MDKLNELIHFISRNKVKVIEVVGNLPPRKTKVQEFYDKLTDGSLTTDREAAQFFYDTDPSNRNYKELKKRLTNRLLNTALFIDVQQSKYDDAGKAYYSCWKDYAIAKILLGKGAYLNAHHIMKKILRQSIKYGFTELILDITRLLRLHYGTRQFNKKEFERYNELFTHYEAVFHAENLAEELYSRTLVDFFGKSDQNQDMYKRAQDYEARLRPYIEQFDSYKLHLCFYLIRVNGATSVRDHTAAITICREALRFFKLEPEYSHNASGIFARQLFLLYWQQRRFEEGEQLLEEAKAYTPEGNLSWFTNYDYFFMLCLHDGRYKRAYETLEYVMHHARFKALPEQIRELWRIYRAYIHYLIGLGKIEGVAPKSFRINKFLNEVPIYSKDKRGTNIPILIIQILLLILYKRYNEVIDRMEAVEKYCHRHLKKDETFRSNCFIKMLLKMGESSFHRAGTVRKTEKLRKQLHSVPLEVANQVYETEIIPYEDLWELALESLDNSFWKGGGEKK